MDSIENGNHPFFIDIEWVDWYVEWDWKCTKRFGYTDENMFMIGQILVKISICEVWWTVKQFHILYVLRSIENISIDDTVAKNVQEKPNYK